MTKGDNMAEIKPFNGIIYNSKKIRDISDVICPPYDVINETDQAKYHMKDDHNAIRIVLGKSSSSDGETDNKYIRAAHYLAQWLDEGVLIRDDEPSLYVYEQ